jgi:CDP-glucose 4,6-dehydratase
LARSGGIQIASKDGWRDLRVLVTGADGFVGSHLAGALVRAGADVTALVHRRSPGTGLGLVGIEQAVTVLRSDIASPSALRQAFATPAPEVCFHLAAQTLVTKAQKSPRATFATNVMGTVNILEACRLSGVEHVVLASSDKAYGASHDLPYREDTPLLGNGPYEASKVGAELAARVYAASYGLTVSVSRCANIYGGGDLNFSRLIPDTIQRVLRGRAPRLRSDGSPRRDYIYIDDAVRAYLALAEFNLRGQRHGSVEAFNFGSGQPVRVREVVELILELAGRKDLKIRLGSKSGALHEIQDQWLDAGRAHSMLQWRPTVELRDGLRRTVSWYEDYLGSRPTASPA